MIYYLIFAIILAIFAYFGYKRYKKYIIRKRLQYIDNYTFPKRVKDAVLKEYPHLSSEDVDLVIKALKDYFKIAVVADGKMVAMPSQVVDVAWHEFLLFTKEYQNFSYNAFGKFFHHHPFDNSSKEAKKIESLSRVWNLACKLESINPKYSTRLPLIFEIDKKLDIKDGFSYKIEDLKTLSSKKSLSGGSSCGGCSGYAPMLVSHSSDNGADGGCGGSGCSGGCGGGCGGG